MLPGMLMGLLLGASCAQAVAQAIYTCVDAKGRRHTADRPIHECLDREQQELNPSGSVKRKLVPSLTARERAAEEDNARKAAEEQNRATEEKRRDRALLTRYANQADHDRERAAAITRVDDVLVTANKRSAELVAQRKALDADAEFFKKDPAKLPARLKRLIEENEQLQVAQQRFAADQAGERQRVNARFDEELVRLRQLWPLKGEPATAALPAATKN